MILLYLKDEGGNQIKGEYQYKPYVDWVEIDSIEWKAEEFEDITEVKNYPGGGGAGKRIAKLTFFKGFDRASPILYQKCIQTELVPKDKLLQKAVFRLVKASGVRKEAEKFFSFLVIACEGVRVVKWNIKNSESDPIPTEEVSISFDKVTIQYKVQDPENPGNAATVSLGWNYLLQAPYSLSADELKQT